MSTRTWKCRLFSRHQTGVYEWRGWTMPVLRLGRWSLELTRWTHQVEREPEVEW